MTNKEIVRTWYSALETNDFDTIRSLMDDKYQFRNPMTSSPMNAEEHLGMMNMMKSAFEGRHKMELFIEDESHVAVTAKWSAKHTGDFSGIPATGRLVELYLIDVFKIVNRKVVDHHVEFNPMLMLAQIGDARPK